MPSIIATVKLFTLVIICWSTATTDPTYKSVLPVFSHVFAASTPIQRNAIFLQAASDVSLVSKDLNITMALPNSLL